MMEIKCIWCIKEEWRWHPLAFTSSHAFSSLPQAYKRRPLVSFQEELRHYNNHIHTRLHKELYTTSTSKVIEDLRGSPTKVVHLFLQWLQPITWLFIKYRIYTMWWSVFFKILRFKPIKESKHHIANQRNVREANIYGLRPPIGIWTFNHLDVFSHFCVFVLKETEKITNLVFFDKTCNSPFTSPKIAFHNKQIKYAFHSTKIKFSFSQHMQRNPKIWVFVVR